MCIFLTNILQNRRKRISAKLLNDGTNNGHTLPASTQCRATIGPPAKCHSNVLEMLHSKKGRKEGGVMEGVRGGWRPT